MARKMLGDCGHSRTSQATRESVRKIGNDLGLAVKGTITDDLANAPVEIHTGCEAEVDVDGPQLRRDQPAGLARGLQATLRIPVIFQADAAHRRNLREAIAKSLHPAAFVVNGDQQRRTAQGPNVRDQVRHLFDRLEIAREQDHAAHGRLPQQLAVGRAQGQTLYVEHHGSE